VAVSSVGCLPDGTEVGECRLRNDSGMQASILTLGATLRTLLAPNHRGEFADVVLGYDSIEDYLRGTNYLGATIGRYANRIAHGRFRIGGQDYQLALNNGPNAAHGGTTGFDRKVWQIDGTDLDGGAAVHLSLLSPDGDQGYPGELVVRLSYRLSNDNALRIDYTARSSRRTILNLSHHSYWNLAARDDALQAYLSIESDAYTPLDQHMIPTGELRAVAGTVFDFRTPQVIAARMRDAAEPQLAIGSGYDHNFVLRGAPGTLRLAARLVERRAGRALELLTTEPGLQFYAGNTLSGLPPGKGGRLHRPGEGVALEPQHFPDSPNHPHFPSTLLEPGRTWTSSTVFRFLTVPAS
jgi:aldose 1-epimerase